MKTEPSKLGSSQSREQRTGNAALLTIVSKRSAKELADCLSDQPKLLQKHQKTLEDEKRALEQDKKAFEDEQAHFMNKPADDVLALNVGGTKFDVLRSSLTFIEGTMLAAQFSGRWDEGLTRDTEGRFFLYANPEHFAILLDFLRSSKLVPASNLRFPSL